MEKEVLIHVKGLHMMDTPEGDEPIEIVVPGEYYFRNGSHYLRYEEMLDEQGDPTINYIKISSRGMEVRKKGQVNTHMVFEQGKRNMAFYTTPFGTLEMGISATNLELEESDGQIAIFSGPESGACGRLLSGYSGAGEEYNWVCVVGTVG